MDEPLKRVMKGLSAALRPIRSGNPYLNVTGLAVLCCIPIRARVMIAEQLGLSFHQVNHQVNNLVRLGWVKELPLATKGKGEHRRCRPLVLTTTTDRLSRLVGTLRE